MAQVCMVTGKGPLTGMNVSHSHIRTKKRSLPNLHWKRFWVPSENRFVKLRVSAHGIRIINKHNIDHVYVLSVSGPDGIQLRTDSEIFVAGESVATVPVSVTVPHENAWGGNVISFELTSMDNADITVTEESRFRGPTER